MKVFMSGRTAINPNFIKGCIGIAEIKPGLATVCSETAVCLLKRGIADNEFCAGSGFILQNRNTVKVGRTAFDVHFTAAVDFQVKHADFLIVVFVNRPNQEPLENVLLPLSVSVPPTCRRVLFFITWISP